MQGVAGQQQPGTGARVGLQPQIARRGHEHPRQAQPVGDTEPARQPHARPDRRERGEQRVQQLVPDAAPVGELVAPRPVVRGREPRHRRGRGVEVAGEHGRTVVGQHVREHVRGVPPAQPVPLEVQTADDRGRGRHRVEGAEHVVPETGFGQLGGAHRTPGPVRGLQHQHVPAGVRECVGRHQTVVSGADDDGVHRLVGPVARRVRRLHVPWRTHRRRPYTPPRPHRRVSPGPGRGTPGP